MALTVRPVTRATLVMDYSNDLEIRGESVDQRVG